MSIPVFKEFIEVDLANKKEVSTRKINVEQIVEIVPSAQKFDDKNVYCVKLSNGDVFYTITSYLYSL